MTAEELKRKHIFHNPGSHFFDSDTLSFFGERMSEMRVLQGTVNVKSAGGFPHTCYILSSRQNKAPGGPRRAYHYFDTETFEHVIV